MGHQAAAHLLLRIAAAFAFFYPAARAVFDPLSWVAYMPRAIQNLPTQFGLPFDSFAVLHLFGAFEVLLALWVLSGRRIRIPAALMTILLLVIVFLNWNQIDVLFRDLTIAAMTLALFIWPVPSREIARPE